MSDSGVERESIGTAADAPGTAETLPSPRTGDTAPTTRWVKEPRRWGPDPFESVVLRRREGPGWPVAAELATCALERGLV